MKSRQQKVRGARQGEFKMENYGESKIEIIAGEIGRLTGNLVGCSINLAIAGAMLYGAYVGVGAGLQYALGRDRLNPEYNFNGRIGAEQVEFVENLWGRENVVSITRPDKTVVELYSGDDFRLEKIVISSPKGDSVLTKDSRDPAVAAFVKGAQPNLEQYLSAIAETKINQFKR